MSADSEDLDAIDSRMQKAAATSADGVSVQRRSADDEIKWRRYKREEAAAAGGGTGLKFFKTSPPGAT